MNEKYIQTLRSMIQQQYKCSTRYSQTIKVKEESGGKVLFEGNVELFDLGGHPTARQCFAWGTKKEDGHMEYATVLNPPAKSAAEAVRSQLQGTPAK